MVLTRAEARPRCPRLSHRCSGPRCPQDARTATLFQGSWRKASPDRTSREALVLNLALLGTHTMTLDKSYLYNERTVKIIPN